ncbi:MAG: hypothetical protein ACTSSM_03930 [Promethearchaeota archaeon]
MASKKLVAGIIIGILSVGILVGLIPVFMYGLGVDAISLDLGMASSGSPSSSSTDGYSYDIFGGTSFYFNIQATPVKVNPYEYFFRQMSGVAKVVSEKSSTFSEMVNIVISMNLTTPTNKTLSYSFSLKNLKGIVENNINLLLGPNELEIVNGTYHISIIITVLIYIDVPPFNNYNETITVGPIDVYVNLQIG